ncbi:hypothetical protein BS636_05340 [Acinetobacter sp. LoGeW2-3]|uniref:hypothetical protein n=1 Tax=Acinetobacter sp. LoGeW2-3 TaxID=1808001 RepID=UPI000C05922B|nr:hypothetical protein [Acinetobacter sp. LoGeW2-3]ATO19126.1 hypothetical protein BS636_05340 [Acinetobacter sp. LoGeW2-3]
MVRKLRKRMRLTRPSVTPHGRYVERKKINEKQLEQMYSIYQDYYENTQFSLFLNDFKKKTGAILLFHPQTDDIIGFSTVAIHHFELNDKKYTVLFSGDTVVHKDFWGARTLPLVFFKLLVRLRVKYAFREFYWLLISKGYKTYLLLANNYFVYYPHFNGKHKQLSPIVEKYCHTYFPVYFDTKTGLLNFGNDYQPLKGEVAPITLEMRKANPKIDFFETMNPTWHLGTELPCIGRFGWSDLARYPIRLMTKPPSKGQSPLVAQMKSAGQGLPS